jgi:EmrB/QacA subfamily drug resistance transporter
MKRVEDRFIVAGVYAVALFMDLLDSTIVNVALPTFAKDFRAGTTAIEWVVTGYLLSLAAFIPVSGWAGDRFGTKRTLLVSLGIFTVGSLLCSLAWSLESLVAFRVIQGIGGGMLTPVGAAMLYRAFPPEERARVSSILTVPAVLAPASGPLIGGYLLQVTSWRALFWLNVPIGLLLVVASWRWLREQRQDYPGRFDAPGFVLAALGLSAVLNGLARAGDRGLADPGALAFVLGGAAILAVFAVLELRTAEPMLDLRLFREPLFARGITVQLFAFGAQFGTLFLLPLLLQTERGLSPLESGLTTFPQAIGVMLLSPMAGRIYRRVGPRRLAAVGLTLAGVTTLAMMGVDLQTDLWWIRALMLARGGGFALSLIAMQTATFARVPRPSMGRGTAIYSVTRQVGVSLTVAILATVLSGQLLARGAALGEPSSQIGAVVAFHAAFGAAALLAFIAAIGALLVDDRRAAGTLGRENASMGAAGGNRTGERGIESLGVTR